MRCVLLVCATILVSWVSPGCGGSDDSSVADAGPDLPADIAAATDGAGPDRAALDLLDGDGADYEADEFEARAPNPCFEMIQLDATFDLFPEEALTQIHATAVFDGEGIWVAYNTPDLEKKFDVRAARISCNSEVLVEPFTVNLTSVANELDPAIAVQDDVLCIAWQSDNGTGVDNLDIFWRTIGTDGVPVMDTDALLTVAVDGSPQTGNAWMPSVAPHSGGFAIAGAFAIDGAQGFQTAVQKVSSSGEVLGEATVASFDPEASQIYPSLAASDDDTLHLAWTRTVVVGKERVEYALFEPGAGEFTPFPAATVDSDEATLSANLGAGTESVFLSYDEQGAASSKVFVTDGADFTGEAQRVSFGSTQKTNHTSAVLPIPGGGYALWYRMISGSKHDLMLQHFVWDGLSFEKLGVEVQLNDGPAAPYPAAAVHLGDGYLFAAWSEGTSPDFVLKGRFVNLAAGH